MDAEANKNLKAGCQVLGKVQGSVLFMQIVHELMETLPLFQWDPLTQPADQFENKCPTGRGGHSNGPHS